VHSSGGGRYAGSVRGRTAVVRTVGEERRDDCGRSAEAELTNVNGQRGLGLSDTEARIVDLVCRGATNREIARATFLSVKAIEANLTRLYRRFGVRNREQLSHAVAEMSSSSE
jgi:DNA-binding CsgD family transcriptional regulator